MSVRITKDIAFRTNISPKKLFGSFLKVLIQRVSHASYPMYVFARSTNKQPFRNLVPREDYILTFFSLECNHEDNVPVPTRNVKSDSAGNMPE